MAIGLVAQGFDNYVTVTSNYRVRVLRFAADMSCDLFCSVCCKRMSVTEEVICKPGIPEPIVQFCLEHRHKLITQEVKKMNGLIGDGFYAGIGGGGGISSSIDTYKEKVGDPSTELVLAVAKASNFKVNAQGKQSGYRNMYRLFCTECKAEFDLGYQFPTALEVEQSTTAVSKFCVEHAHRPTFKAVDADNFRKIREA